MRGFILSLKSFVFFLSFISHISAQEFIPATGGDASGQGGTVSFTLGQLFCKTITGETSEINEGVQQPYEIFEISALENLVAPDLKLCFFPNPVSDILVIKVLNEVSNNLVYKLTTLNGQIIIQGRIEDTELIDMSGLTTAAYLLSVFAGEELVKVYKVIKK